MGTQDQDDSSAWRVARRHWRRAFARDLQSVPVTSAEQAKLDAAGVHEEPLRRYAVWRRSVLVVVIVPTLAAACLATAHAAGNVRIRLSPLGVALTAANVLALWALPVAAVLAVRSWASFARTHRIMIAAWACAFVPPFIIAVVPLDWWFELSGTAQQIARERRELAVFNVVNGLHVALVLLPAALAILPGVIRGCLRVKSLLPAAILPGWFLVTAPAFYLLLAVVLLIVLNHVAGGPLLVLGVLLSFGAPMVYVLRADLFVRPLPAEETAAVDRIQTVAAAVSAAGSLLLLGYLFTEQVLGRHLVGLESEASLIWLLDHRQQLQLEPREALARARSLYWLGDVSLTQVFIQYCGRSLFMTAVFADMLVRMCLSVWGQERRLSGTPAAAAYDKVMNDLNRELTGR